MKSIDKNDVEEHIEVTHQFLGEIAKKHCNKPWIVAFSGGKDSSVLTHLIVDFLKESENRPPRLIILYNDTLSEIPTMHEWVASYSRLMIEKAQRYGIDIWFHKEEPKIIESFYWRVLVRRYPMPTFKFRWCTDLLKINPTKRVLQSIKAKYDGAMLFVGVRLDESKHRNSKIKKALVNTAMDGLLKFYMQHEIEGVLKVAPILTWPESVVWDYVNVNPELRKLIVLYCKNINKSLAQPVRYGCWHCTLAKHHGGLQASIALNEKLGLLEISRRMLKKINDNRNYRLDKEWGYSKLGPLNERAQALVYMILEEIYWSDVELYGLKKEVINGISLGMLFFEEPPEKATLLIHGLDPSSRASSFDMERLRHITRKLDVREEFRALFKEVSNESLDSLNDQKP